MHQKEEATISMGGPESPLLKMSIFPRIAGEKIELNIVATLKEKDLNYSTRKQVGPSETAFFLIPAEQNASTSQFLLSIAAKHIKLPKNSQNPEQSLSPSQTSH